MDMVILTSADRVRTVSTVISIIVLALLFVVLAISFTLYYHYYKKCIDNELEDGFLRGEIKNQNKGFFKKFQELLDDKSLTPRLKVMKYRQNTLVDEVNNVSTTKKTLRILLNIGLFLVYGAFVALLIFSIYIRASGEQFMLGNSYYVIILSGSMETVYDGNTYIAANGLTDQIATFSMIGLDKVDSPEDIELYDIVSYYNDRHELIVHRVIDIKQDEEGEYIYRIKGDANAFSSTLERELPYSRIDGVYNGYQNFGLGLTLNYLRSNIGIIAVSLGLMLIGVYDVFDTMIGRQLKLRKEELYPIIDEENIDLLMGVKRREGVARDGTYLLPGRIILPQMEKELRTIFASQGVTFKTNGLALISYSFHADDVYLHLKLLNQARIETKEVHTNVYNAKGPKKK